MDPYRSNKFTGQPASSAFDQAAEDTHSDSQNPTDLVWDVLINELPKTAADDLARAVVGYLGSQGWAIVRLNDYVKKDDLAPLVNDIAKAVALQESLRSHQSVEVILRAMGV